MSNLLSRRGFFLRSLASAALAATARFYPAAITEVVRPDDAVRVVSNDVVWTRLPDRKVCGMGVVERYRGQIESRPELVVSVEIDKQLMALCGPDKQHYLDLELSGYEEALRRAAFSGQAGRKVAATTTALPPRHKKGSASHALCSNG